MLMDLAFVPPDDVIASFDELLTSSYYDKHSENLDDLITYFEATWIGKPKHNINFAKNHSLELMCRIII